MVLQEDRGALKSEGAPGAMAEQRGVVGASKAGVGLRSVQRAYFILCTGKA